MAAPSFSMKIERANKHIEEFRSVIDDFRASKPYAVGHKRHPDTNKNIYFVTRAKPIPAELAVIAGDVLQNLRTALDYLICDLVVANGKEVTRNNMFPVFNEFPSSAGDKNLLEQKIDGVAHEAKEVIRRIKPYKGGDDLLWQVHALNIRDKHRTLFMVATGRPRINLGEHIRTIRKNSGHIPNFHLVTKKEVFPLKVGTELFWDPPNVEVNKNVRVTADVALNEPPIYEGPLGHLLIHARDHIQEIIASLEKWVPSTT